MSQKSNVQAAPVQPPTAAGPVLDPCDDCPPLAADDEGAITLNPAGYGYVIDQFAPTVAGRDGIYFALAMYRSALVARGWRRVFVADAITGQPGTFVQLWRVPVSELAAAKQSEAESSGAHAQFVSTMSAFKRAALNAMPYDPPPAGPSPAVGSDGPPNVLLLNDVTVRAGALARFACLKQSFFVGAVGAAPFRWRLVGAGAYSSDRPNSVLQMWELPDADTLPFTMRRIGQNATYRRCLEPCIEREDQQLYEVIDWS